MPDLNLNQNHRYSVVDADVIESRLVALEHAVATSTAQRDAYEARVARIETWLIVQTVIFAALILAAWFGWRRARRAEAKRMQAREDLIAKVAADTLVLLQRTHREAATILATMLELSAQVRREPSN